MTSYQKQHAKDRSQENVPVRESIT